MELIIEIIVWFAVEIVFWGVMFWTGYVLTKILTLGRWNPGRIERAKDKKKERRKETKYFVTAIIGALFWIIIWIGLIIVINKP